MDRGGARGTGPPRSALALVLWPSLWPLCLCISARDSCSALRALLLCLKAHLE